MISVSDSSLSNTSCPICGSNAKHLISLPYDVTKSALEYICNAPFSADISYPDYDLLQCENCTLEFSSPMAAPNDSFYLWLTNQNFTYEKERWEWKKTISLLQKDKQRSIGKTRLVDIGCGSGNFLIEIQNKLQYEVVGIDHNEAAVEECKKKGLLAYCQDISKIKEVFPQGANIVTLWHVLEHVDNPLQTLMEIKNQITNNGIILISVPLSPMSHEALKPDPFNAPPHHLTRWSPLSLTALGKALNMQVEIFYPENESKIYLALKNLIIHCTNGKIGVRKPTKLYLLMKLVVSNPAILFKTYSALKRIQQRKNNCLSDVALIKLTNTPSVSSTSN